MAKQVNDGLTAALVWVLLAVMLFVVFAALCSPARADCGHFFRKKVVVQQVVAPAYAAPIVYAAPVYYSAGVDIQIEAAVEKALRLRDQAPAKGYQQPVQAPVQAPIQAPIQAPGPKGGTLEPLQNVQVGTFAKCTRCHAGENAAGGLVLDGQTPIDTWTVYRWNQIAGQGRDVPAKMQGLIGAMTPEQKGAVNDALLDLVAARPQPVQPPPPPVADGGLQ